VSLRIEWALAASAEPAPAGARPRERWRRGRRLVRVRGGRERHLLRVRGCASRALAAPGSNRPLYSGPVPDRRKIDLHCHILPGLDDGAIDLDDSVAMAEQAESDGIEIVSATPHIRPDHEVVIGELAGRVAAVNEELEKRGLSVRLTTGGEVAEPSLESLTDEELCDVSLGRGGSWILVEPRPGPVSDFLLQAVQHLGDRGFRTVVAHPERHPSADFRERLEALVKRGALIQVTSALIADGPAAPTMLDLASHGLVHLLASDAHSPRIGRAVRLSDGLAALERIERVKPHLDWVAWEGPQAILRGEAAGLPFGPE
jgi:protein-tyrosine phosphatase